MLVLNKPDTKSKNILKKKQKEQWKQQLRKTTLSLFQPLGKALDEGLAHMHFVDYLKQHII